MTSGDHPSPTYDRHNYRWIQVERDEARFRRVRDQTRGRWWPARHARLGLANADDGGALVTFHLPG